MTFFKSSLTNRYRVPCLSKIFPGYRSFNKFFHNKQPWVQWCVTKVFSGNKNSNAFWENQEIYIDTRNFENYQYAFNSKVVTFSDFKLKLFFFRKTHLFENLNFERLDKSYFFSRILRQTFDKMLRKISLSETWTNIGNLNAIGKHRIKKRTFWEKDYAFVLWTMWHKVKNHVSTLLKPIRNCITVKISCNKKNAVQLTGSNSASTLQF